MFLNVDLLLIWVRRIYFFFFFIREVNNCILYYVFLVVFFLSVEGSCDICRFGFFVYNMSVICDMLFVCILMRYLWYRFWGNRFNGKS